MKTLADFKRAMKVGAMVQTIYHKQFVGRDSEMNLIYGDKDLGVREVSIVQSTQVAFKTPKPDGTFKDSYLAFPKAKDLTFNEDGSVSVSEGGDKILTYKFV